MITQGELKPGEWVDEVSLAKRFKVSRTPVREAFSQLETRGILVARDTRGVQVTEVNQAKLAQMYEAMSEIEALCARLAAHRISWLQRAELEAAHKECVAAAQNNDRQAFLAANEKFHLAIYRATLNEYIERVATEFRHNTAPFRAASRFRTSEDMLTAVASHQKILEAVTGSKSDQAFTFMQSHITETGRKALSTQ